MPFQMISISESGPLSDDMICHACGHPLRTWHPKVVDSETGQCFAVYRCSRCGLGHTLPQPESMESYYTSSYYGNRHGFTAGWCARRRISLVSSVLGPGSGRRLLDVGCGDGAFLLSAKKMGWRTAGTEMNPIPARKAGLHVRESLEEADLWGPYDCITLWHSLEHLRNPNLILKRLTRLLQPNGHLVIGVPDAGGLQSNIFGRHWFHLDVPRHLYHFSGSSLARLLQVNGFTILCQKHQEFEYDLLGWAQSALNFLLPVPNVFFATLTHRNPKAKPHMVWTNLLLGSLLSVIALPALAGGTLARRGGTIVVVARRT